MKNLFNYYQYNFFINYINLLKKKSGIILCMSILKTVANIDLKNS